VFKALMTFIKKVILGILLVVLGFIGIFYVFNQFYEKQTERDEQVRVEKIAKEKYKARKLLEEQQAKIAEQARIKAELVEELTSNIEKISAQIQADIEAGEHDKAIKAAARFDVLENESILALKQQAEKQKQVAAEAALLQKVEALPKKDISARLKGYQDLLVFSPDNEAYQISLKAIEAEAEIERKKQEQARIEREEKEKIAQAEANKEAIEARRIQAIQNRWNVSVSHSELDDSKSVYMHLKSQNSIPNRIKRPIYPKLWLRCSENTTSFIVTWDVYLGINARPMTYRLDSDKARTKVFDIATNNKSVGHFSGGKAIPFIKKMFSKDKLLLQITPYSQNPAQITFDISGLEEAVKPLREACGW
jgi:type VI secretion system protein VasI